MTIQIKDIEQLTQKAVRDVFRDMLSMEVSPEAPMALDDDTAGQIIGSVGFVGETTGIIYLYAGATFGKVITSLMLGIEEAEVDANEMVNDAVGELTNMVVGSVKSQLCDSGFTCVLTIPSIVRGRSLSVEASAQSIRRVIGFRNSHHHLKVEILLKQPQPR